jgi:hypothetical protein
MPRKIAGQRRRPEVNPQTPANKPVTQATPDTLETAPEPSDDRPTVTQSDEKQPEAGSAGGVPGFAGAVLAGESAGFVVGIAVCSGCFSSLCVTVGRSSEGSGAVSRVSGVA